MTQIASTFSRSFDGRSMARVLHFLVMFVLNKRSSAFSSKCAKKQAFCEIRNGKCKFEMFEGVISRNNSENNNLKRPLFLSSTLTS